MHISLIGMSNIGKSHWSRQLAAESYERVECDALVEKKLAGELIKLGYHGINDVAKWMGQPYDAQYPDTSRKYLACEREVMLEAIELLQSHPHKPIVIDTTGSVIYTGSDITEALKALTRIIYLEASPQHIVQLFERYMANPKPVIWGDSFNVRPGETLKDSLGRCYADLLGYRAERYKALAHVTLPFESHKARNVSWNHVMKHAEQTE